MIENFSLMGFNVPWMFINFSEKLLGVLSCVFVPRKGKEEFCSKSFQESILAVIYHIKSSRGLYNKWKEELWLCAENIHPCRNETMKSMCYRYSE